MEKKQNNKSNAWGVAGFVCSLFGLIGFFMPYFGLPLSVMAVVGYYKQKQIEETGLAMAANVIGIIGIVLNTCMLLFMLIMFAALSSIGTF